MSGSLVWGCYGSDVWVIVSVWFRVAVWDVICWWVVGWWMLIYRRNGWSIVWTTVVSSWATRYVWLFRLSITGECLIKEWVCLVLGLNVMLVSTIVVWLIILILIIWGRVIIPLSIIATHVQFVIFCVWEQIVDYWVSRYSIIHFSESIIWFICGSCW